MANNEQAGASERRCTRCGAEIPPNLPPDLCPKCLLEVGMGTQPTAGPGDTAVVPQPAGPTRGLPQPGQQFGHYQIVRLLGAGGMGAVYEAEDLENGRRVALKILGYAFDSPEARQRFFREGRLAASINHPNSVYVFGTEEISGIPVIAMELVPGGTLRDQVLAQGPLTPAEAVDVILQVIAGLEAAQKVGVLHRDVKPSNCFIDADGTIKIGDFGLSLSTAVRADSNLTATGVYLGTPAFSPPEQLRGEELTVRSDIYAVGVTLYHLLTGRMPFEAPNMVQLLATVLEHQAESPAKWRAGIPKGLCQAVLKCLEKDAGERFKNYQELRAALAPYSSTAPTAAALGLRFLAGLADALLLGFAGLLVTTFAFGGTWPLLEGAYRKSTKTLLFFGAAMLVMLAYYSLLEGLRGASLGKALFRLRVVGTDRNPPGILKGLVRALMFLVLPALPYWLYMGLNPLESMAKSGQFTQTLMSLTFYVVLAILFSTARRRNGFAGLHDLATNTRVIRYTEWQDRPALAVPEPPQAAVSDTGRMAGPYHVIETLQATDTEQWLLGYDTRLLRKVLIHVVPPETAPFPPQLRNLGRPGRVRWLTGRRSPEENWDAFEGLTGKPLLALLNQAYPWSTVRFWVLDLANEIAQAERDRALPEVLGLDRVWITVDGRAKLLDFPAPGIAPGGAPHPTQSASGAGLAPASALAPTLFLDQVARSALEGRIAPEPAEVQKPLAAPVPLHARTYLDTLPKQPNAEVAAATLRPLMHRLAQVTQSRRGAILAACLAFPILAAIGMVFGGKMIGKIERSQPEIAELSQLLQLRSNMKMPWVTNNKGPDDRTFGIYIASHYRQAITNPASWSSLYAATMIKGENRIFAEQSIARYPNPSEQEVREATQALGPYVEQVHSYNVVQKPWFPLVTFGAGLLVYVALPALLAALLFRGGLVLLVLGVTVARKNGVRAGRLHVFWRSLVAWAPVLAAPFIIGFLAPVVGIAWAAGIAALLAMGWTIWSLLLPGRSLQDRIAGTCLVPR